MSLTLRARLLLFLVPNYLFFFSLEDEDFQRYFPPLIFDFMLAPSKKCKSLLLALGSSAQTGGVGLASHLLVLDYLSVTRALALWKMFFFLSSPSRDSKSKPVQQDQFGLSSHSF